MPEATSYILFEQTNKKVYKAIEEDFRKEHKARCAEIERRWKYYDGDHDLPLKRQGDGYNDSVIVNHVEALTDRLTAFLIGDGVTFDASGDDTKSPDDQHIEDLLTANRGDLLIEALANAGAVEGHNTVRIQAVEGAEPKLTRIKQQNFAAFWDPFDMSRVLWYRLQHVTGAGGKRIDYVRGTINAQGQVGPEAEAWTEVVFSMPKENQWKVEKVTPWPYPFPPLVDWQNLPNPGGYYGKNDIAGAMRLNDALNFILSNTQRIIKHHAAPKTVGIGFNADQIIPTEVGGLFTINKPRSEVEVFNLELQSDGSLVKWLAGVIQAGLWESGGMIDPANVKDSIGQLTNFGLRILFTNAIKRTDKKRLLYAEAFETIIQRALELGGQPVPETITTIWPDVLPEDEATVNALMAEREGGVISMETYRKLRGYDHAEEVKRLTGGDTPAEPGDGQPTTGTTGAALPSSLESDKGLNGAQITAAIEVLSELAAGRMPESVAAELLISMGIDEERVNRMAGAMAKSGQPAPGANSLSGG